MMKNKAFSKTMFLPALVFIAVFLLSIPARASVWQSGSTETSVTIAWSNPPASEIYYVDADVFGNFYNSDYNAKTDLFDDIRVEIPVANILSITVEWGQNGFQHSQVLQADTRSYTISGLSADAAYDVMVNYKYTKKGDDGKLYVSSLGTTVASTDSINENTDPLILETGKTYKASELSFSPYKVRDDSLKSTCTINMDRDVTVKSIEIVGDITLVLTGNGTLTVTEVLFSDARNGFGTLRILENASLKATAKESGWAIRLGELYIDTTGKVTATGTRYKAEKDDDHYSPSCGIGCNSLRILNGTVVAIGADGDDYISGMHDDKYIVETLTGAIYCGYFLLTGGNVTARGGDFGMDIRGGDVYVTLGTEGRAVQLNLSGTRAALIMHAGSSKNKGYSEIGDLIIDSPLALTTPAGGNAALKEYQFERQTYNNKFIVDSSGNIAKHAEIKIPLVYSVEASLANSSIKVGDTTQMKYETKASDFSTVTGSVYRFTSDDEKVATVDANGLVKGVGPGKTKITVTDTAHGNVSAALEVTVKGISGNFTVGSFRYKVANGVATLTGPKNKNAKSLKIPATIKIKGQKIPVNKIGKNAFKGMPNLTSLTIGKNVKSIGANAMRDCRKLKYITIRTIYLTDKSVGANAFKNLKAIVYVKCPKGKVKAYEIWLYKKGLKKGTKVK